MQIFLTVLFGFLAGVIGGMGMGGGTVLVPLLSFLDMPQKTVQAVNLISFLPMCAVALVFHAKNKLVKPRHIGWIAFPATATAALGAMLAGKAQNKVLRLSFALFLIAVGIWQLVVAIKFAKKQKLRRTVVYSSVRCLKAKPLRQQNTSRTQANAWLKTQ